MKKIIISIILFVTAHLNPASLVLEKISQQNVQTCTIKTSDGQTITFDAQLLLQSKEISESVRLFHSNVLTPQAIEQFSHDLFTAYNFKDDDTVDKVVMNAQQAQLLLEALKNNTRLPGMFAVLCPKKDRLWLINHLSRWNIKNIYHALLRLIIHDITLGSLELNMQAYEIEDLYDPIAMRYINEHCIINSAQPYVLLHACTKYVINKECCSAPLKITHINSKGNYAIMICREHVHIYDILEHTVIASLQAFPSCLNDTIMSAQLDDHNRILITTKYNAYIYDLETKKRVWDYHCPYGSSIIGFVQDGTLLYVQEHYNKLISYNTRTGEMVFESQLPEDLICRYDMHNEQEVAATPDGTKLIAINYHTPRSTRITLYDLEKQQLYPRPFIHHFRFRPSAIRSLTMNSNHTRLLITTPTESSLHDIVTYQSRFYEPLPQLHLKSTQFVNDDQHVLIADTHNIALYDVETNNELWRWYRVPYAIDSATLTPDKTQLIIIEQNIIHAHAVLEFTPLELHQKLLLKKAAYAWNQQQPYIVEPNEIKLYKSLPSLLHKSTLFSIAPQQGSKKAEKKEDK